MFYEIDILNFIIDFIIFITSYRITSINYIKIHLCKKNGFFISSFLVRVQMIYITIKQTFLHDMPTQKINLVLFLSKKTTL